MANINLNEEILYLSIRAFKLAPIKRSEEMNLVIMCSGGIDSIAMTHYLMTKKKYNVFTRKTVFHFNHNLRNENNLMENKVKQFCKDYGFDYISRKSPDRSIKSEAECRELRFREIRSTFKDAIIVTAHHLNDMTESYLLNVFRGHPEYSPIPFYTILNGGNVISHPFVFTEKKDFEQYVVRKDLLKYVVEDSTNKNTKGSRRNMIRNKILPILEEEKVGLNTIVKRLLKSKLDVWC